MIFKKKNKEAVFFQQYISDNDIKLTTKELAKLDVSYKELDLVTESKGYETFYDLRMDEQIKYCLYSKKLLIIGKDIVIDTDNQEIKEFIEYNFENLEDQTFTDTLWNILTALEYGFSVSEIIWKKENNKVFIKKIKTVPPWNVEFKYDEYGNLIELYVNNEKMPLNKFLIFSYFQEFGNKRGYPELASVWNAYWFKKIVQKFWALHLERFGSPIIKGRYPFGADEKEIKTFHNILSQIHNLTSIVLPRSQKSGEEFDFELIESKREGGSQFKDAMEYADFRILKAFLLPQLFGGTSIRFGSYALAEKQFEVVYKLIDVIQKNLLSMLNKKLIKPLVLFNFKVEKLPSLKIVPYTQQEIEVLVKEIKKYLKADKEQ